MIRAAIGDAPGEQLLERAGAETSPEGYQLGAFELDVQAASLVKHGVEVLVGPKILALLVHLVRERHRVVCRSELLEVVWKGVFVSEAAVASALRDLRRALGDDGMQPRFIMTRKGLGYRFIHPVQELYARATGAAPPRIESRAPRRRPLLAEANPERVLDGCGRAPSTRDEAERSAARARAEGSRAAEAPARGHAPRSAEESEGPRYRHPSQLLSRWGIPADPCPACGGRGVEPLAG